MAATVEALAGVNGAVMSEVHSHPPKSAELGLQWCRPIENRPAKDRIAYLVAAQAQTGQVIGAGSGSTSFLTVLALGTRVSLEDLHITVVPTSIEIELACRAAGLDVSRTIPERIDWCFDGADEVDPHGTMIKGRGGALHRERLVFAAAKRRLIIADRSKSVERLGMNFPVPVEVEPDWIVAAHSGLQSIDGVDAVMLRQGVRKDGPVITEGGRVLFDVRMRNVTPSTLPAISSIPGVCCVGIFEGYEFDRVAE